MGMNGKAFILLAFLKFMSADCFANSKKQLVKFGNSIIIIIKLSDFRNNLLKNRYLERSKSNDLS